MDNAIDGSNPYRSPQGLDDSWENSALEECVWGITIPGYTFISEYLSDKRMQELGQGDFRTNFVNGLPECFLWEVCRAFVWGSIWYGLSF